MYVNGITLLAFWNIQNMNTILERGVIHSFSIYCLNVWNTLVFHLGALSIKIHQCLLQAVYLSNSSRTNSQGFTWSTHICDPCIDLCIGKYLLIWFLIPNKKYDIYVIHKVTNINIKFLAEMENELVAVLICKLNILLGMFNYK